MKTLLLIRHAKAQRAEARLSDHDRTLEERGRRDAVEMGRRLSRRGVKPDLIVSSSALRASATARLIAAEIGYPAEAVLEDRRLYASSVTKMLYLIQEFDDKADCVALVGHNPEMSELSQRFSNDLPEMATCAVAELDFDCARWTEIGAGAASRTLFDVPKKGQD